MECITKEIILKDGTALSFVNGLLTEVSGAKVEEEKLTALERIEDKIPTLKIEVHGNCTFVWLNGVYISPGLKKVEFSTDADDLDPRINLYGISLRKVADNSIMPEQQANIKSFSKNDFERITAAPVAAETTD